MSAEITITDDMAKVELETRQQLKSNLWFRYRAGRVTAPWMKAVCHTDVINPAQSLIKVFATLRLLPLQADKQNGDTAQETS